MKHDVMFLPPDLVLARFSAATGIPVAELSGPATTRAITWQRHVAMWILRQLTSASLSQIGAILGRDPKSVENGIGRVADRLATDSEAPGMMQQLVRAIVEADQAPAQPPEIAPSVSMVRQMAAAVLTDPFIANDDAIQAAITLLRSGATSATETLKGL